MIAIEHCRLYWPRLGLGTGLSVAKGVEGKIKAGVPPLGLTHCLHIFLGGDKAGMGGVPFFGASSARL